jgi:hypothetical protein
MSDERGRHPSPGVVGRVAHRRPADSAAPWAPAPADHRAPGCEHPSAAFGVAAVPSPAADVVPAAIYEVRAPARPALEATTVRPEPPVFVARIPTSSPPEEPMASPVSAPAPRNRQRRLRLTVTAAVALCLLGAAGVGYVALARSGVTTQAQVPVLPGAPSLGGGGVTDAVRAAPPSAGAGLSASPSATASTSAATSATPIITTLPTTKPGSASAEPALPVVGDSPESSPLGLKPAVTPSPAAGLAATLTYSATSTGDGGLARYTGTVVLDNPRPDDVGSWELTLTVPGGNAVAVRGAVAVNQSGESVDFTPAAGSVVPAGGSFSFGFTVRGILSDLPADCAVDGSACS